MYVPYPIPHALRYVDPRTDQVNPGVDLAVLLVPAKSTMAVPYEVPKIRWGNSTRVGVGDTVVIAGYPLGTDMFLLTKSNRGIIQPTFYNGIISAVLPATGAKETRLFQVSIAAVGGMSGGAMFNPETGEVLGMVTSGLTAKGVPLPMTYVLPSEVIAPYTQVITFQTEDHS